VRGAHRARSRGGRFSGECVRLPRVLIAAPGSGHGKTMVTTGVMAALCDRGLEVSPHKVGPDYIDPGYHAAACGRSGRNLDPYLQGEHRIPALLLHGAMTPRVADIAVIEGVMGLFDGAVGMGGFSSSAHVAGLVAAPVVLVVDCAAVARSVGAIVHGFSRFDDTIRVAGVILNNVGSPRHEAEARDGVAHTGVPVLGVIPRLPDVVVPSRHLGLIPVAERQPAALEAVAALSLMAQKYVDLDALVALARTAPDLDVEPWSPVAAVGGPGAAVNTSLSGTSLSGTSLLGTSLSGTSLSGTSLLGTSLPGTSRPGAPRIAVAGGAAFSFGYAETSELLVAAGAEVVGFDPLHDESLPPGVSGLLLGGGFPQVHASDLSANAPMRRAIRRFADDGGAISAECAGLLYLGRQLDGAPMCGVLPVTARMGPALTLGYRSAVALSDNVLCARGERVTGHEFHRTEVVLDSGRADSGRADSGRAGPGRAGSGRAGSGRAGSGRAGSGRAALAAWGWQDAAGRPVTEGLARGAVHASYLHVHWAGHPAMATRFVSRAAQAS
jgi:cobyrinic acid a,c-diamide synthase